MSTIQVLDKTFEPYLKEAAIQEKITELAEQLNKDYAGKRPLFLSILNGSFLFTADLFKQITICLSFTLVSNPIAVITLPVELVPL